MSKQKPRHKGGVFKDVEFRRDGSTLVIAVLERPSATTSTGFGYPRLYFPVYYRWVPVTAEISGWLWSN